MKHSWKTMAGGLLIAAFGFVVGTVARPSIAAVPNPYPYPINAIAKRTKVAYFRVTAGATAQTLDFGVTSKAVLVVNEGADTARFTKDADVTATTTVGNRLAGGVSFSDPQWSTTNMSYIRTGAVDTTLNVEVTYDIN